MKQGIRMKVRNARWSIIDASRDDNRWQAKIQVHDGWVDGNGWEGVKSTTCPDLDDR